MNRSVAIFFVVASCLYFAETQETSQAADYSNDVENIDDDSKNERRSGSFATSGVGQVPLVNTVECYACIDCPNILPNTTTKQCPVSNDPTENKKCVAYLENYTHMAKIWVVRGCASERNNCEEIKRAHSNSDLVKLLGCKECEGDRCNSGMYFSSPQLLMSFSVLIVTPLLKKYIFL